MNKYIIFKIDGQTVDLPQDFTFDLTFKNSNGFGTSSGASSERSVNIPATKNNKTIFESWEQYERDNLTAAYFKPCTIEADGLPIFSGLAQLKNAPSKNDYYLRGANSYQVALFADNSDWISKIKGLKLRDLGFDDDLHDYTVTNVANGLTQSYPSNNYAYGLIKTEDWAYQDASNPNIQAPSFLQFSPVYFVRSLLDKIFNPLGFSVFGTWLNSEVAKGLCLPLLLPTKYPIEFSEDYLNVRGERVGTITIPQLTGIDLTAQTYTPPLAPTNPLTISGSTPPLNLPNTAFYTAPQRGFYQVNITFTPDNFVSVGPSPYIGMYPSSSGAAVGFFGKILDPTTAGQVSTYSRVFFLEANETVQLIGSSDDAVGTYDILGLEFEVIGEAEIGNGTPIQFKYFFKDWLVSDFIKGLIHCFNLKFETNTATGQITIEPKDDWLYQSRTPVAINQFEQGFLNGLKDFTDKVDLSKTANYRAKNDTRRRQGFVFAEAQNEPTIESVNNNEDLQLYEARLNLDEERFRSGLDTSENPFFTTVLHVFDSSIQTNDSPVVPQLPLIFANDYRTNPTISREDNTIANDYSPKLLWFQGGRTVFGVNDGKINAFNPDTNSLQTLVLPALFAVNYNDDSGLDPVLSYADINGVRGLFSRYYINDAARMRAGKLIEEYIFWNDVDILNLSFRDKIRIGENEYILEELNSYNPILTSSILTKATFDQYETGEDFANIESSSVLGYIGFITIE